MLFLNEIQECLSNLEDSGSLLLELNIILKKKLKKVTRITVGILILLIGIIMIVTPGPALVVIPTGLAVLSSDFAWARLALMKMKKKYRSVRRNKALKKASFGSFVSMAR